MYDLSMAKRLPRCDGTTRETQLNRVGHNVTGHSGRSRMDTSQHPTNRPPTTLVLRRNSAHHGNCKRHASPRRPL